jgi:hypothetical protein
MQRAYPERGRGCARAQFFRKIDAAVLLYHRESVFLAAVMPLVDFRNVKVTIATYELTLGMFPRGVL